MSIGPIPINVGLETPQEGASVHRAHGKIPKSVGSFHRVMIRKASSANNSGRPHVQRSKHAHHRPAAPKAPHSVGDSAATPVAAAVLTLEGAQAKPAVHKEAAPAHTAAAKAAKPQAVGRTRFVQRPAEKGHKREIAPNPAPTTTAMKVRVQGAPIAKPQIVPAQAVVKQAIASKKAPAESQKLAKGVPSPVNLAEEKVSNEPRSGSPTSPVKTPKHSTTARPTTVQTMPASSSNAASNIVGLQPGAAPHAIKAAAPAHSGLPKAAAAELQPAPRTPAGWKIQPAQVHHEAGIRRSSWVIHPPLAHAPPMKMEVTQEGSRLKADLTVNAQAMGLFNATPTALPHHAVHLPEGVATLEFSLMTQGGMGGGASQSHPQARGLDMPQVYANAGTVPQTAGDMAEGTAMTGIDYRA